MCTIEKLSKIYYENGLDVITHYLFTNPYIYNAARARINEFCIQSIDDLLDYEFGFKYGFNKTH